jgi:hypothetical protein
MAASKAFIDSWPEALTQDGEPDEITLRAVEVSLMPYVADRSAWDTMVRLLDCLLPLVEIWEGTAPQSTMQQFNATVMSNDLMPPVVELFRELRPPVKQDA